MSRAPAFRFDPPPLRPDPALAWVLARAFASGDAPVRPPPDASRALALARDLDLSARIASRVDRRILAADLGDPRAADALEDRRRVAAQALHVLRVARDVALAATDAGVPLAFLKGAALHLGSHVAVSARGASDVDVLVDAGRAADLHRALSDRGYRARGTNRSDHHLPPLGRGDEPWVEIHTEVPGCRLPGRTGPLTLAALADAGLLEPVDGLPAPVRIPRGTVLAAHALVHGIDDHGFGADRYPPLRMACDLADLLGPGAPDPATAAAVRSFVGDVVTPGESLAALELVAGLCAGVLARALEAPPAGRLLAHLVAGGLDPAYRDALRLRQTVHLLRTRGFRALGAKARHQLQDLGPGAARIPAALRLAARLLRAEAVVRWKSRGFFL